MTVPIKHKAIRVLSFLLVLTMYFAAKAEESWTPPAPSELDMSWVQLTSGEWLKGDIIGMYEERLEFDSDKLGDLSLKWKDIKVIYGKGKFGVFTESQGILVGQLVKDGNNTIVRTTKGDVSVQSGRVVSVAPRGSKKLSQWSYKASFGYTVKQGNSDEAEYNATANIKRRSANTRGIFDYIGYVSTKEDEQSANNHRLTGTYDRYLTRAFFFRPVQLEIFKDKFQNIDYRATYGVGAGYTIIDDDVTEWDVAATLGYQTTQFNSVEEGKQDSEDTPAFTFSTHYDRELTDDLDWETSYSVTFVNEASGRYTHHFVSTLSAELTKYLDLDLSFVWDRIDKPQPDQDGELPDSDDYRMVVGVGVDY
ncbi:DUF481 domain-containing protein [Echinimonas agarilytica]|uniref:DUF481 domain-containing protein n=1 Tax=Echinimonas agarilytica TaxID=1215918 RepID=A0AA41WBX5_9GAMM|nr:DUF481 domain-containing protein [Echinimonas agarilytica]MCM2681209.1 DUF481 domain-containing protein [Echinimonas agarilytica]